MSDPPYRLGACGGGSIFTAYERAAQNLGYVEFSAVAEPDAERRRRITRPGCRLFADVDTLLDEKLDAIVILSPNYLHTSQAMLALERGFPVLCEKPLGVSPGEARRVVSYAERRQRHLRVAMHCRFRPEVSYLYKHIDGPVVSFEQRYLENWISAPEWFFNPRQSGGGVLLDVGINQLDWLLPLLGNPTPAGVAYDTGGHHVEMECEVEWVWDGGRGRMRLSWRADDEEKVTLVTTATGSVFELNHQAHSVRVNGEPMGVWECREYEGVLADFLSRIGGTPEPDFRALRTLELLSEAYGKAGLPFLGQAARPPARRL